MIKLRIDVTRLITSCMTYSCCCECPADLDEAIAVFIVYSPPESVLLTKLLFVCRVRSDRSCYQDTDLMNGLSNLDETYRKYLLAFTDDRIGLWRSKVKVTAGRRGGEGIHVDAGA